MITVPALVLVASVAAIFFFFLLSSLSSSCSCGGRDAGGAPAIATGGDVSVTRAGDGGGTRVSVSEGGGESIWSSKEDVEWVKDQIQVNGLHMQDNVLRKGINPRTRAEQLQDLLQSVLSLFLYYICICLCDWKWGFWMRAVGLGFGTSIGFCDGIGIWSTILPQKSLEKG